MDTKQLAAFCAVVERRSFSQAADQLGVTQPAVSLQIRALEQQLLEELGEEAEGELKGRLEIGASTGPGGSVLPVLLGEFQELHPQVHVALTVSDTHTVIVQVGRRELELGVVGASGRHRGVSFEPLYR